MIRLTAEIKIQIPNYLKQNLQVSEKKQLNLTKQGTQIANGLLPFWMNFSTDKTSGDEWGEGGDMSVLAELCWDM